MVPRATCHTTRHASPKLLLRGQLLPVLCWTLTLDGFFLFFFVHSPFVFATRFQTWWHFICALCCIAATVEKGSPAPTLLKRTPGFPAFLHRSTTTVETGFNCFSSITLPLVFRYIFVSTEKGIPPEVDGGGAVGSRRTGR